MRTPEPGETWVIRDSQGTEIYILLFTDEPCARGYLFCLVLWAVDWVSLEVGEHTHYQKHLAFQNGSLLS